MKFLQNSGFTKHIKGFNFANANFKAVRMFGRTSKKIELNGKNFTFYLVYKCSNFKIKSIAYFTYRYINFIRKDATERKCKSNEYLAKSQNV